MSNSYRINIRFNVVQAAILCLGGCFLTTPSFGQVNPFAPANPTEAKTPVAEPTAGRVDSNPFAAVSPAATDAPAVDVPADSQSPSTASPFQIAPNGMQSGGDGSGSGSTMTPKTSTDETADMTADAISESSSSGPVQLDRSPETAAAKSMDADGVDSSGDGYSDVAVDEGFSDEETKVAEQREMKPNASSENAASNGFELDYMQYLVYWPYLAGAVGLVLLLMLSKLLGGKKRGPDVERTPTRVVDPAKSKFKKSTRFSDSEPDFSNASAETQGTLMEGSAEPTELAGGQDADVLFDDGDQNSGLRLNESDVLSGIPTGPDQSDLNLDEFDSATFDDELLLTDDEVDGDGFKGDELDDDDFAAMMLEDDDEEKVVVQTDGDSDEDSESGEFEFSLEDDPANQADPEPALSTDQGPGVDDDSNAASIELEDELSANFTASAIEAPQDDSADVEDVEHLGDVEDVDDVDDAAANASQDSEEFSFDISDGGDEDDGGDGETVEPSSTQDGDGQSTVLGVGIAAAGVSALGAALGSTSGSAPSGKDNSQEVAALNTAVSDLEAELKDQQIQSQRTIGQLESERDRLQADASELASAKESLVQLGQEKTQAEEQFAAAESDLQKMKAELDEANAAKSQQLDEANQKVTDLESDLEKLAEKNAAAEAESTELKSEIDRLGAEVAQKSEAAKKSVEIQKELDQTKVELTKMEAELEEAVLVKTETQSEVDELKSSLEELKSENETLAKSLDQSKIELKAAAEKIASAADHDLAVTDSSQSENQSELALDTSPNHDPAGHVEQLAEATMEAEAERELRKSTEQMLVEAEEQRTAVAEALRETRRELLKLQQQSTGEESVASADDGKPSRNDQQQDNSGVADIASMDEKDVAAGSSPDDAAVADDDWTQKLSALEAEVDSKKK